MFKYQFMNHPMHRIIDQCVRDINASLDDIRLSVNAAYIDLWKYIRVRTTYWKDAIYQARSLTEIANDAFSRWKVAADVFDY